jgi:hypothetical protein
MGYSFDATHKVRVAVLVTAVTAGSRRFKPAEKQNNIHLLWVS